MWLAAAGQVFFTLSVGWGIIHTYTSYLREDEDVALAGLSTASLNEFAEVVLGGTIAITAAVVFFGITATQEIATSTFDLGFQAMAIIFQKLPFGHILGGVWFFLLFLAGLTSAVAITQPAIALIQEGFQVTRTRAVVLVGLALLILSQPTLLLPGVLDELDFWVGTFALLLFGLAEAVILSWVIGIDRVWAEITRGAQIRVPRLIHPILRYVTPVFLALILFGFAFDTLPKMLSQDAGLAIWLARGLMVTLFLAFALIVRFALRASPIEEV